MALNLILTRHAKSSWDDPLQADHDRPLNDRGRASAVAIGNWLRTNAPQPSLTLSSSSERTRETCDLMALGGAQHFTGGLYHAGPDRMLAELQNAKGQTVLMIGHNPGIASFAEMLSKKTPQHPRFHDYPTCATTVFSFDCENWSDVSYGTGAVQSFVIPRELLE